MSVRSFRLKYGKGEVDFDIPEDHLLYVLQGRNLEPPKDLASTYRQALDHPIDAPPLSQVVKPGDRVAITVSDITRGWQRNKDTLPLLVEYLNEAGVRDEDITVIIAVGAHRQNTAEEFVELCSNDVCHRVRVVNHNAWDTENIVHLRTHQPGHGCLDQQDRGRGRQGDPDRRRHLPLHGGVRRGAQEHPSPASPP